MFSVKDLSHSIFHLVWCINFCGQDVTPVLSAKLADISKYVFVSIQLAATRALTYFNIFNNLKHAEDFVLQSALLFWILGLIENSLV